MRKHARAFGWLSGSQNKTYQIQKNSIFGLLPLEGLALYKVFPHMLLHLLLSAATVPVTERFR